MDKSTTQKYRQKFPRKTMGRFGALLKYVRGYVMDPQTKYVWIDEVGFVPAVSPLVGAIETLQTAALEPGLIMRPAASTTTIPRS